MTADSGERFRRGAILAGGAVVFMLVVIGTALGVHSVTSGRRTPQPEPQGGSQTAGETGAAGPAGAAGDPGAIAQAGIGQAPGSDAGSRAAAPDGTPAPDSGRPRSSDAGVGSARNAEAGGEAARQGAAASPHRTDALGGTIGPGSQPGPLSSKALGGAAPSTGPGAAGATAGAASHSPAPTTEHASGDRRETHPTTPTETPSKPSTTPEDSGQDEEEEAGSEVDDDPDSDRTPPALDGLRFDPPEINDGGLATLYIQASDDLSGPGSVTGVISSPSGGAMLPFRVDASAAPESVFAAKIPIPAKAETGLWFVANLVVYDKANNPLIQRFTSATVPPGGALRVTSAESDSTPPEILRMSIERSSMSGGEKNRVRVEIQDDRSGVASVRGTFQSPSKASLVPFVCQATGDPAVWQGEFLLPTGAECGAWTVQSVRPADNAGNSSVLAEGAPQAAGAGFSVSGADCDAARPSLVRLTLSPDSVMNDSDVEINVTAELEDPNGKTASITGWVAGPVSTTGQPPMILFSCTKSGPDPTSPWTGKILVKQHSAKGTWTVRMVRLRDSGMYSRDYTTNDPVLSGIGFTVR